MNRDEHKAKDITFLLPKDKNKRPMNRNCYVFLLSWIIFQSSEAFPKSTEVADYKKILTSSETETTENCEKDVEVRLNQLSSKTNII